MNESKGEKGEPTFTCVICKKELTTHEVLNHASLTICEGSHGTPCVLLASLTICEGTHPEIFAALRKEGRIR